MDDKEALEDVRDGGYEGEKILRERYETRLCEHAARYLPEKDVKDAVEKAFDNLGKDKNYKNSPVLTRLYDLTDYAIDEIALEDVHNGGKEGYEILHKHYADSLCNYLMETCHLSEISACKVVEEIFVEFYNRILNFKKSSGIKTWLNQKMETFIINYLPFEHLGFPKNKKSVGKVQKSVKSHVPLENTNDVVQDTFLKFITNSSFKHQCSMSTWLAKITKSAIKEHWRKTYKEDYPKETNDNVAESRLSRKEEIKAQNPRIISMDPHFEDEAEEKSFLFDFFLKEEFETQEQKRHFEICIQQVKARLKRENAPELSDCLKTLLLQNQGFSIKEIAEKINRTDKATKEYLSQCKKRLAQYHPLQECWGIFLKMCLEDLQRENSDKDFLACLQAHISELEGKSIKDIAQERGKTQRYTKDYLSECKKKLMKHPNIPKRCREWLKYLYSK